ncbi:hypothetical protein [Primorskyibacter marinus]|uniref:hypothetical protein n=1 Tax=Primorskyibacter marinus TaxID=1977320 RepID=UPI000E3014A8|nr:hypothetical protein [Primorskyibacter marinus]
MVRAFLILGLCLLAGCSPGASHLPNPLSLPGQAVATGLENAAYNARRARLAWYVQHHHAQIIDEIAAGTGPRISTAMELARVPAHRQHELLTRLREDIALYRKDAAAFVVALMVHGP